MSECIYCTSSDLQKNVAVEARNRNTGDVSTAVGLPFKTGKKAWLSATDQTDTEPVRAEVCKDCGTVRFYVEDPKKDWFTE